MARRPKEWTWWARWAYEGLTQLIVWLGSVRSALTEHRPRRILRERVFDHYSPERWDCCDCGLGHYVEHFPAGEICDHDHLPGIPPPVGHVYPVRPTGYAYRLRFGAGKPSLAVKAALLALLLHASALAAPPAPDAPPDCEARPAWCKPGFVCQPTACAAEAAAQLGILTAELDAARARRWRRFHADFTCGAGVASALISRQGADGAPSGLDLDVFPSPAACVVGIAFRLGR